MAQPQGDQLQQILDQLGNLTNAVNILRQRQNAHDDRPPVVVNLRTVPKENLLKPSTWKLGELVSDAQRRFLLTDLRDHFTKHMWDGENRSRDFYEYEAHETTLRLLLAFVTNAVDFQPEEAIHPQGLEIVTSIVKRLVLLKERTENGLAAMQALERRFQDQGYEPSIEAALKEVRARQQAAALARSTASGHADMDSALPKEPAIQNKSSGRRRSGK
jgi:hypothetical protein